MNVKYCLGPSCYVIKFNKTHLLLDCGLELASLLHFFPYNLQDKETEKERERKRVKKEGGEIITTKKTTSVFQTIGNNVYVNAAIQLHPPQFNLVDLSCIDAMLITNFYSILF